MLTAAENRSFQVQGKEKKTTRTARKVNRRIRTQLVGDKTQGGARGILDDLLRWIRPGDTAVLVSDHGFTELGPCDGVTVTKDETAQAGRAMQEDVLYRYVKRFRPSSTPEAIEINTGQEKYFLAIGHRWFSRVEAKGAPVFAWRNILGGDRGSSPRCYTASRLLGYQPALVVPGEEDTPTP